jgi:hypothetical protein
METSVLSPTVSCVSLTSTHVSQLTDDCMDQLTRKCGSSLQCLSVSVYTSLDHYYGVLVTHVTYIYCKLFSL